MFASAQTILHVDMDAFFASVEQARRPALRGVPVIVGGMPGSRGVVAAASYEARAHGVHAAMPLGRAHSLCPQAVVLPVDMSAYHAVHTRLVALFSTFTDKCEVASIDEAFLDVTRSRRLFGPPQAIANRIHHAVYQHEHITCSIGIGPTKLLAKLASGFRKPGGITELTAADVHGRLRELPVRDLWGIGPATEERLIALGITTVALLQDVPLVFLTAAFGPAAQGLKRLAFGQSVASVRPRPAMPKSVSSETTFAQDNDDRQRLRATLLDLADRVASRMRRHGLTARVVTIKVRFESFHTVTRRTTLSRVTESTSTIYRTATSLLDQVDTRGHLVRLLGLAVDGLHTRAFQLTFDDGWKETALYDTIDRVRAKYGSNSIRLAGAEFRKEPPVTSPPGAIFTA
ncbi:MAG: DNA polymerase IV [Actinobacteria bacterium]|nr:DNA polymerase IV [Actinomycetota bacterium]